MSPNPKPQRPRWCPRCRELRPWQKVRPLGARCSFRACTSCGSRTRPRMPGTRKRAPRPDSYRVLMKRCDDIARARAYARGVCEIQGCGRTRAAGYVMEWAHGFSRGYHFIRHLDQNGRLLCRGHHTFFSDKGRSEDWREWLIQRVGAEAFEEMRARRNDRCDVLHLKRALAILEAGRPLTLKALDGEPQGGLLDSQQPALAGS